jgi:hypothetical protein
MARSPAPRPRALGLATAALATAVAAPIAAHAGPRDTRDLDLSKTTTTELQSDPVYGRDRSDRWFEDDRLDLARTTDGSLVAAFVEWTKGSQRLVVMKEDRSGNWSVLEDRSYMWSGIADVSLAVADDFPSSPGNERVFVALELHNPGAHYVGLASGSLHHPWKTRAGEFELQYVLHLDREARVEVPRGFDPSHPEVEVFPLPEDDDYAVGIAFEGHQRFEEPSELEGAEPYVFRSDGIYLAFSLDHGRSVGDALHVVGRNAPAPRGPLDFQGDAYFHPDLVADVTNRLLVLAVQDDASGDIFLLNSPVDVAAVTAARHQKRLNLIEIQSGRPGVEGHLPRVGAAEGRVHLTYLHRAPARNSGHAAGWLSVHPYVTPALDQQATVHRECASEVDIEVREGTAFLAAACYPDDQGMQWPMVTAFEVTVSNGATSHRLVDDDRTNSVTWVPRVAATPASSRQSQRVTTGWNSQRGLWVQTY